MFIIFDFSEILSFEIQDFKIRIIRDVIRQFGTWIL